MTAIQVLDMVTANRIAAGEVVERPASIVKELLENAIDAGSTAVTVEIEDGGLSHIRVTDNGSGIDAGDALLSFERHATSKIRRAEDLDNIETLGFRGEALPSIAAVSQVRMTTRVSNAETGHIVEIHGGTLVKDAEYACPEGTRIEVDNLFFNTPVRRNFLKKPQQEAGVIGDYLARMILAHPELAIKYVSGGKTIYHSPGDGELRTAVFCVYGTQILPMLREAHLVDGDLRVYGYIGRSEAARPNRTHQTFIVNGRWIKSAKLSDSVLQAYDTRLMAGKFPVCILHLTLAAGEVDVNIHPGKMEVRFKQEARVLDATKRCVLASLQHTGVSAARLPRPAGAWDNGTQPRQVPIWVPLEPDARKDGPNIPPPRLPQVELEKPVYRMHEDPDAVLPKRATVMSADAYAAPPAQAEETGETPGLEARIIGQVFETYWLIQDGEALYWIDQHAAHERLLYDRLMAGEHVLASQRLLEPSVLRLHESETARIAAHEDTLRSLGFEITLEGSLRALVHAVPMTLGEPASLALLHEAVAALGDGQEAIDARLVRQRIARMACKAAVKAGDALDKREIQTLLNAYKTAQALTCPHGRPVMLRMTRAQIEKMFGRIN